MSKIEIKQLYEEDWKSVKFIRLRALQYNSNVFLSNYDKEVQYEENHWKNHLRDKSSATFGLFDRKNIIGLSAIFTWYGDKTGKTAILVMSFIEEAYRKKGYSKLFYKARIAWAKKQGSFDKIRTSHKEGNEPSRAANQSFGFQYIKKEIVDWPDNSKDFEHTYELDLRR